MIFHFHTPQDSFMVGSDYIPRIGEKLRLADDGLFFVRLAEADDTGMFLIEDVVYAAPNDPGRQRVDVYGYKLGPVPASLSYADMRRYLPGK